MTGETNITGLASGAMTVIAVLGGWEVIGSDVAWGQGRIDTIARTGDLAPDGNGTISSFDIFGGGAALHGVNQSGQVLFSAALTDTNGGSSDDSGIFVGTVGLLSRIVREGDAAPDGDGVFLTFDHPKMNDAGQVAFFADLSGTNAKGIFLFSSGSITTVARDGQLAPGGGSFGFNGTEEPSLNSVGDVGFRGDRPDASGGHKGGIYTTSGGSLKKIVIEGDSLTGTTTEFSALTFGAKINNSNQAAFYATLDSNEVGIFTGTSTSSTSVIAQEGQPAPDSNGVYASFSFLPMINSSDEVSFYAEINGASGGADSGVFRGTDAGVSQIVRLGDAPPDGNGTFSLFPGSEGPPLNDVGDVAFEAFLSGTSGGSNDNSGIFVGSGADLTQIVRKGEVAPDGSSAFQSFDDIELTNGGQVVFQARLDTGGGGIYMGDGVEMIQVLQEGETIDGVAIASHGLQGPNEGDRGTVNQYGQVSARVDLVDGSQRVVLFAPDLHWRSDSGGSWDNSDNWTLGLDPTGAHDVFVDPPGDEFGPLTISGPGAGTTTVNSLSIVESGLLGPTLSLNNGGDLTVVGDLIKDGDAALVLENGSLTVGGDFITNFGLGVASMDSTATINGNLSIGGRFAVLANGAVHVGGDLTTTGGGGLEIDGGSVTILGTVYNAFSLTMNGGTVNSGTISNDMLIQGSGTIDVSFFENNATGAVAGTSTAAKLLLTGDTLCNSGIIDNATVDLTFLNGCSVADTTISNVDFTSNAQIEMEIGGLMAGVDHDVLNMTGETNIDNSTLNLVFINGFTPKVGDTFDLINVDGTLTGGFDTTNIMGLPIGFEFTAGFDSGVFRLATVTVPEPFSCFPAAIGLLWLALAQWRRREPSGRLH